MPNGSYMPISNGQSQIRLHPKSDVHDRSLQPVVSLNSSGYILESHSKRPPLTAYKHQRLLSEHDFGNIGPRQMPRQILTAKKNIHINLACQGHLPRTMIAQAIKTDKLPLLSEVMKPRKYSAHLKQRFNRARMGHDQHVKTFNSESNGPSSSRSHGRTIEQLFPSEWQPRNKTANA